MQQVSTVEVIWKRNRESILTTYEYLRIIFASSGLGLLQIISEPDNRWYASEGVGPQGRWIVDFTTVGEENKTFLNKGVETSTSRHV